MTAFFDSSGDFIEFESREAERKHNIAQAAADLVTVDHRTAKKDCDRLIKWISHEHSRLLRLKNISFEGLEELETELRDQGLKIRHDWFGDENFAVFLRMGSIIHECPGPWLHMQLGRLNEALQSAAQGKYRLLPDGRLDLKLSFPKDIVRPPFPRVVLETAYSQTSEHVMDKALAYLANFESHIHAVIVVDMKYPVTAAKDFWAEISVWTRVETGNIDNDFPYEISRHVKHRTNTATRPKSEKIKHSMAVISEDLAKQSGASESLPDIKPEEMEQNEQPYQQEHEWQAGSQRQIETQLAEALGVGERSITQVSSPISSSATAVTGDDTKVPDESQPNMDHKHPKSEYRIVRRYGPVGLIKEENAEYGAEVISKPPPELVLDVYDFLRTCPRHYDEPLPDDQIRLPLDGLQRTIEEALARMRLGSSNQKRDRDDSDHTETSDSSDSPGLIAPPRRTRPPGIGLGTGSKRARNAY
ncbi:hypothetical protein RhiJN_06920 [Ceratobasidium sp. AG-Ba]|nr:hypothetical protein RhiJN_06920 [Ceratobasidium sp. AG-Ba]QRW07827.1 hypothetical protein RhiLY_06826 [Ceratobasidium sp. AG-Ba]